jgi:hypothetical protein
MHTSSGVDNIDEYLETVTKKATASSTSTAPSERPVTTDNRRAYKTRHGMAQKEFTVYRTHHGPIVREAERQVGEHPADAGAAEGAEPVVLAHEGEELQGLPRRRWSCTPTRRTTPSTPTPTAPSPTSTQLHSEARSEVRLDQTGGRQRSRDGMERRALD